MRHTKRALAALAALAVLSVAVVGGCGDGESTSPSPTPFPSGAADITGSIETLTAGAGDGAAPVSMLVVADPAVPSTVDRALVRVTADTLVWEPAGEGRRSLSVAALVVGRRVAVRFSGPVAESYPVQATAGDVEVLSPRSED